MNTHKGLLLALLVSTTVQIQADVPPASTGNPAPAAADDSKKLEKGAPTVAPNASTKESKPEPKKVAQKFAFTAVVTLGGPQSKDSDPVVAAHDEACYYVAAQMMSSVIDGGQTPAQALAEIDEMYSGDRERIRAHMVDMLKQYEQGMRTRSKSDEEAFDVLEEKVRIAKQQVNDPGCLGKAAEVPMLKTAKKNPLYTVLVASTGALVGYLAKRYVG